MDEKQFLKAYCECGKIISTSEQDMDIKERKKYKNLTSLIDYKCGFDKNGNCHTHRGDKSHTCCCSRCKRNVGYLNVISYNDIYRYVECFDEDNGFWTSKGCSLPRELRSTVCLTMSCKGERGNRAEQNLFSIIRYGKKSLDAYYEMYLSGISYGTGDAVYDHLKKRLEIKI